MSSTSELREHVRAHAENRPGVYRMYGPGGEVLYVGKSVRVRTRLLSYFRAKSGKKAKEIVSHSHRIEWDYTANEFAALLTELRQIKQYRPIYNVAHKRDRAFCFIKLTREAVPRLYVARKVTNDGALYYGPFRGRRRVRDALRELRDVLELRDCSASTPMRLADQVELFRIGADPLCLRADLGRCLAPCAAGCTRQQYMERVELARRFLEGDADAPLATLRARMQAASERMQFEYAAELRDRIERLHGVRDELIELQKMLEVLSCVYFVEGHDGDDRAYILRRGHVQAELPAPGDAREREALGARVREIFRDLEPEGASIPPHQAAEILLTTRWFRRNPEERENTTPAAHYMRLRKSA